jgi:hypothetical protein
MLNLTDFLALLIVLGIVLFIVWNNWPDLVEKVGIFLIAHAQAIRSRKQLVVELTKKTQVD